MTTCTPGVLGNEPLYLKPLDPYRVEFIGYDSVEFDCDERLRDEVLKSITQFDGCYMNESTRMAMLGAIELIYKKYERDGRCIPRSGPTRDH